MITIKGRFATYGEVWFDEEPPPSPSVDVLTFRGRREPLGVDGWSPFHTLVHDLTVDEDAIFASFDQGIRYEIRRAESKDALSAELLTRPRAALDAFCAFYDRFARQKSLNPVYRRGLEATCDAGRLVLSAASNAGERIVWHAYVVSERTAALLYSASHFRGADKAERALVGRANRWLHWRDMVALKGLGVQTYDWGGMFEDESRADRASINQFKRRFGGRAERVYTGVEKVTARGVAYLTARTLLDRMKQHSASTARALKLLL